MISKQHIFRHKEAQSTNPGLNIQTVMWITHKQGTKIDFEKKENLR